MASYRETGAGPRARQVGAPMRANQAWQALPAWRAFEQRWRASQANQARTASPGSAASPASGGSPADAASQLPIDPQYDQQIGTLGRQRDLTIGGLDHTRTGALLDYGYNATYDASGNATGLSFDPNNPDSRAAQLKKRYLQAKAGTGIGFANRGQQNSSAYRSAQTANDQGYQVSDDRLQKALLSLLGGNQQARGQAGIDYEFGSGQAYGDRLGRLPTNPLENQSSPAVSPADAAAGAKLPGANPNASPELLAKLMQWNRKQKRRG